MDWPVEKFAFHYFSQGDYRFMIMLCIGKKRALMITVMVYKLYCGIIHSLISESNKHQCTISVTVKYNYLLIKRKSQSTMVSGDKGCHHNVALRSKLRGLSVLLHFELPGYDNKLYSTNRAKKCLFSCVMKPLKPQGWWTGSNW